MTDFISIPLNAITDLTAIIGTIFADLWVLIAFAIGVPLAFYAIKRVIGLQPKK